MDNLFLELTAYALQILLIIMAISIIAHKNNGTIIILITVFSLITASLYVINKAPDVAIAEVAIGSAIIPLIYVISISRQREFIILDKAMDNFIIDDGNFTGIGYILLKRFSDYYHLELNITNDARLCQIGKGREQIVCEQTNVDLIVSKDQETGKYQLKGKASNVLLTKLEQMAKDYDNIEVIKFKDRDFGE
ncbi:MAG: Na(+)/H(+) antiporter subunit B [Candidatus Izemoplasmataceae bacterium]